MEAGKLTEVITFRDGDRVASLVTDGTRTKTYESDCCREHTTTLKAIAYLESQGYHVQTDEFI